MGSKHQALMQDPKLAENSANSSRLEPHGHSVQFYEDDAYFLDDLSRVVGSSLGAGDAAVVIATKPHRDGLAQRLNGRGVDLPTAIEQGRYIALDASETLEKFMVNGWPDAARFVKTISPVIARANGAVKHGHPRLAAFGEMVALLWAEGKADAAIKLEELWNDLSKSHSFNLHCAYPMSCFHRQEDADRLRKICAEHTHVVPTESYTSLKSEGDRLRAIISLQQKAQALDSEVAERKHIEKALVRREAELADFLENALEGVHRVGPDKRIIWANKALLELLGYSAEEYLGLLLAKFHADKGVFDDFWRRLMRRENLYDFPAELVCKNGSIKKVRLNSNGLWENGEFLHTRCFIRDVTEHARMEEKLRISEERLRLTQRAAKIGSWELDLDSDQYTWSDEIFEMFGMVPTGMKPTQEQFLSMIYYATDRENAEKALRVATSKNKEYETQFRILRPDGQTRWIAARGKPYFNLGKGVVLGVFIDMAESGKAINADVASVSDSPSDDSTKMRRRRIN